MSPDGNENPEGTDQEKLNSSHKKREKRSSRARSTTDPMHGNSMADSPGEDGLGNSQDKRHHHSDHDEEHKRLQSKKEKEARHGRKSADKNSHHEETEAHPNPNPDDEPDAPQATNTNATTTTNTNTNPNTNTNDQLSGSAKKDKERPRSDSDSVEEGQALNASEKRREKKLAEDVPERIYTWDDIPPKIQKFWEDTIKIPEEHKQVPYSTWIHQISRFVRKKDFPKEPSARKKSRLPVKKSLIKSTESIIIETQDLKKVITGLDYRSEGGFGRVFVAKYLLGEQKKMHIAVKKLAHDDTKARQMNLCEVYFLSQCKHDNIAQFIAAYLVKPHSKVVGQGMFQKGYFDAKDKADQSQLWILMEYLHGGTLADVAKLHRFSDAHLAFIAREILRGINFLHENCWAHRDLKSCNVMLSTEGHVKLIDFGLCADFREGPIVKMLGSPYWMPPEMIKKEPHSYPVDVWSFGVCLLELILQHPPMAGNPEKCMYVAATQGLIHLTAKAKREVTPLCQDFLAKCLVVDQSARETTARLLQHEWVTQPNLGDTVSDILKVILIKNTLQTF